MFTWNVQERSWWPSCSHWSRCAKYWTVIRFSFVNEVRGKARTTTCSHAEKV